MVVGDWIAFITNLKILINNFSFWSKNWASCAQNRIVYNIYRETELGQVQYIVPSLTYKLQVSNFYLSQVLCQTLSVTVFDHAGPNGSRGLHRKLLSGNRPTHDVHQRLFICALCGQCSALVNCAVKFRTDTFGSREELCVNLALHIDPSWESVAGFVEGEACGSHCKPSVYESSEKVEAADGREQDRESKSFAKMT